MPKKTYTSQQIIQKALELNFTACGISKAVFLKENAVFFENWLKNNLNGNMHFMENHFEKRMNPLLLHKGTKSVISVLLNYYPPKIISEKNNYKISKYAYGKDYHVVVKEKLALLVKAIECLVGQSVHARCFVDSAPILDRAWAKISGLGWIGKNTCLIRKNEGSFFFIGEIFCDLELEYNNTEVENLCGNCTKCIDACPTGALIAPYTLDAKKCISYLTIEYKGELPETLKENFNNWIYGCDICQNICPHNRFAKPTIEKDFHPKTKLIEMNKKNWEELDNKAFLKLFNETVFIRCGFKKLKRNIHFLMK